MPHTKGLGKQNRRGFRPHLEVLEDRLSPSAGQVAAALAATTASTTPVEVDAVLHWNDVMLDSSAIDSTLDVADQPGPTRTARAFGIVSAAVYDAYNSITHGYEPYLVELSGYDAADPTAAVSAAAHRTLVAMFPQQEGRFDDLLEQALATVPDGAAENLGVELGEAVAAALLAARADDGSDAMMMYTPVDAPGHHGADPENPDQGFLTPNWGKVDSFVVGDVTRFRPEAPPSLRSRDYVEAYNQVKALGGDGIHTPTTRTAEQTEIGIFWAYDGSPALGTPPRLYNQMARVIAEGQGNSPEQNARLLALLNLAMADAGVQCWEAKYTYDFWRPVVGIREGNADTNPRTKGDADWTPLGAPLSNGMTGNFTPPFPAYSSGHATFGTAAFKTIANFYGTSQIPFSFQSDEFNGVTADVNATEARPAVTREFADLDQAIHENALARVYLGVHWIFDQQAGMICGTEIADYVTSHALLPREAAAPDILHFEASGKGTLDIQVVVDGSQARIIDRTTGRVLASQSSNGLDGIVIVGSSRRDRIEIVMAVGAPVLSRGISVDGGGGRDEVRIVGTPAHDTVLVEHDRVTVNGTAIDLADVEKVKLKVQRGDTVLDLEDPLGKLDMD